MIIILNSKPYPIEEPVFKQLKLILESYNVLAGDVMPTQKITAINSLLTIMVSSKLKIQHLKTGELSEFLEKIPDICGFKTSEKGKGRPFNWGDIYAHLSSCCGWTYDYIDNNMTMSRLVEYQAYFAKHPPTHQLVAAYMGYEYQDKQAGNGFLAAIAAQVKANKALAQ
jgi:hypothetical protein